MCKRLFLDIGGFTVDLSLRCKKSTVNHFMAE